MKITIVGTGAMGSVYAGMLGRAGHDVWAIDIWDAHRDAIASSGLTVSGAGGDYSVGSLKVGRTPADAGPSDIWVIATKAFDVDRAASEVAPFVRPGSIVIAFQNGLGAGDAVGRHIPREHIMLGIAEGFGSSIPAPGHVHHEGMRMIRLGNLEGGLTDRLLHVESVWREAGFNVRAYDDVSQMVWEKFLCNVTLSAPCATFDVTIGELMADPETREVALGCASEAYAAGRATGIRFSFEDPLRYVSEFAATIPDASPSMRLDHQAGRRAEIDVINGKVVELGRALGLPVPYNVTLCALLRRREAQFAIETARTSPPKSRDTIQHGDRYMTETDRADFFRGSEYVGDPYPYFQALREECPVQVEPFHGVVMVTGYEEAVSIYTNPAVFSSCNSVTGPFPGFPVPLHGDDVSETIEAHRDALPFSDQIITFDPPKHKDHRGLLMRMLTPRRLRENEDFMWRRANQQMDEFIDRGSCEFIKDYAGPFTLSVIADLLGVPEADHGWFRENLQGGHREEGLGSTGSRRLSQNPLEFLYERFSAYIEERRRQPRQDVLTAMALTTFPDGSEPEVIDVVRVAANLFSAGQETTVRLLGAALLLIGDVPELQQALRADRSLIPDFVEECLRMESPVKGDFRLSRTTSEVGGVEIPAGSTVMVINAAANRDPRRFEQPDRFVIDRDNSREHLAFGRGVHSCPGGPLARAETRISIERLLDRTSDIRISESAHGPRGSRHFEYVPTYILRGLQSLELEFDPVR